MPVHFITGPAKVYAVCGERGHQSTDPARVTCFSCRTTEQFKLAQRGMPMTLADVLAEGVGQPTLRHTPPRMEDERGRTDGVFIFHGTHSDLGGQMEVVPMTSGNVEFTISSDASQQDGSVFSLSHLDRLDLVRALLHDLHYSPEAGGPDND